MVEKIGEFNQIKYQLEELETSVSNLVHKLFGKLPLYFESFKDDTYLGIPFPYEYVDEMQAVEETWRQRDQHVTLIWIRGQLNSLFQ